MYIILLRKPVFSGTSTATKRCPISSETLPDGGALPVPCPSLTPKFIIPVTESMPSQQHKSGVVLLG